MACISKLSAGFAYDCNTGNTGLYTAFIINRDDIASFAFDSTGPIVNTLTLNSGATAYRIDTPKRTLVMSESLKINEGAPNAFTHTAVLNVTKIQFASTLAGLITPTTNSPFVIATKDLTGITRLYGLYYGLYSTSIERSSHDNGGWYTITLATPDQAIGEDAITILSTLYDSLYAAANS